MEFRGVTLKFIAEVELCAKCGHYSIPARVAKEFGKRLDAAYRNHIGLLSALQIVSARKRLGFATQKEFADYLGVGEASVKRWEAGALLDKSNDELIRLKTDVEYAHNNLNVLCERVGRESPTLRVFVAIAPSTPARSRPWESVTDPRQWICTENQQYYAS